MHARPLLPQPSWNLTLGSFRQPAPPLGAPLARAGAWRGTRLLCRAAQQPVAVHEDVSALKAELRNLTGPKYGLDKDDKQKQAIQATIAELEALNKEPEPAGVDLAGSRWRLLYTTSTGNSSGKFGPFIGKVTQDFPADLPGQYYNRVALGPLRADLRASYTRRRSDRLDVDFKDVTLSLGPLLRFTKEFGSNMGGYWVMKYVDRDMRIFYTNNQNVFVLERVD